MKEYIDILEHSDEVARALRSTGVLLSAAKDGVVNSMTMGWAFIGRLWQVAYAVCLVRESRYTRKLIDSSGVFTISVPDSPAERKILGYCGSRSGRDTDKIKDLGLTEVEADENGVPGFKELPLTIECTVQSRRLLSKEELPEDMLEAFYGDGDLHYLYFGKILKAYYIR